ncbi:hypothetical protein BZL30_1501 [Mycobacterium kansasii]|uniref:Uncharacterized protein n=1 Tax=Mycobacterium kansasii TaxID=1768 RepID=A0A1V3XV51_MYCKA|nr:hypothetical protein BZL30_1501 [Mycobacterium kansasii]
MGGGTVARRFARRGPRTGGTAAAAAAARRFPAPQRGLFVVGSGHFETFDPGRHDAVNGTVSIR